MAEVQEMTGHVLLFGYYNKRNYGDDLMGVIFGLHLQRLGVGFKVFGLRPELLARYGFTGSSDIAELLDGARVVIHGGGGLFLTTDQGRDGTQEYERELESLRVSCLQRGIPIYLMSVGGDGREVRTLAEARRRYLDQAAYVGFRNAEDVALLTKPVAHDVYDDVVWTASEFFARAPARAADAPLRVAIDRDLHASRKTRLMVWSAVFLSRLLGQRREYFVFDSKFGGDAGKGERIGGLPVRRYAMVDQFVGELALVDVVLTNRLHMGMTVLAFGGRAIQLFPKPKSMLVFQRLDLSAWQFRSVWSWFRFVATMLTLHGSKQAADFRARVRLDERRASGRRHLEKLATLVR